MFALQSGFLLFLLLLIPIAEWMRMRRLRATGIPLNIAYRASALSPTWRVVGRRLLPVLRVLGLVMVVFAAASPFDWQASQMVDSEGVAIEVIIDRSGSMLADDYRLDQQRVSRLAAVREVAGRFVLGNTVGNTELGSRNSDAIGLVTFAATAEVACPLTLDHEAVVAEMERTDAAVDYREDGTAIGDALALAVAELQSLDQSLGESAPDNRLTKVAILLTDGQHNAGQMTPERAAALARHFGVRTYVIELEPTSVTSDFTYQRIREDQQRMRQLAMATGGQLFSVSSTNDLRDVYATIETLERTSLPGQRLTVRRHWAVAWFEIGPFGFPPIALLALLSLAVESLLAWTVFAEIP